MLTITSIFLRFASANFGSSLEAVINALSWRAVTVGSIALVLLVLLSAWLKDKYPVLSKPIFIMIVFSVVVTTTVLVGSTIFLNTSSFTGGPVHWHADIEIWACGNEIELRDPIGKFNNKIGTATLHEHNDKRIHLEGVPITKSDATLGKFMSVVGGTLDKDSMIVPVNSNKWFETEFDGDGKFSQFNSLIDQSSFIHSGSDGQYAKFSYGNKCAFEESEVQAFVYRMVSDTEYVQTKVSNPASLVISPESTVPPGDCIVLEFGKKREFTDKLCEQFGVRDKDQCEQFGVKADQRSVCTLRDITGYDSPPKPIDYGKEKDQLKSEVEPSCEPFFDNKGNPTGIELGAFKKDGTYLDPEKDCDGYLQQLMEGKVR